MICLKRYQDGLRMSEESLLPVMASVYLSHRMCQPPPRSTQHAGQGHPGADRHKAPTAQDPPRCSTQRAGIAPPQAEGDGLSGVTSDGEAYAFISVPAFVGGVPLTRAMIPWAMPEAFTKRPQIFPWSLIPFSDVKVDPG